MSLTPRPEATDFGMVEVDHVTFYRLMGPLNVRPSIMGCWSSDWGYHSEWVLDRAIVGRSWSGPGWPTSTPEWDRVYMLTKKAAASLAGCVDGSHQ